MAGSGRGVGSLVVRLGGTLGAVTAAALAMATGTAAATNADPVLVGAGDIADCGTSDDEHTAALIDGIAGDVFTAGDNVYPSGTASNYASCYGPSWGRFKSRTHPVMGNHDLGSNSSSAYYDYFGSAAGPRGKGYYSFDRGSWHVIVLNSNCGTVSCSAGSTQERWLQADLAAHPVACTLAIWHHPRYASGSEAQNPSVDPLWRDLYAAGADVVVNGHAHRYERLKPLGATGSSDAAYGMRQFVVGSGGEKMGLPAVRQSASEAINGRWRGVLKLTLHAGSYDWRFVGEPGSTFSDAGSGSCHAAPAGN
jgi:acid phosphatase type 7